MSLFGGVQLVPDATFVFAHHESRHLQLSGSARKRKEDRYPNLCGMGGEARTVVIAGEVGGRWSRKRRFVQYLTQHNVQSASKILQASAQVAYHRRWSSLLSFSAAKAFATSLLERRGDTGAGRRPPSVHEVLGDASHEA